MMKNYSNLGINEVEKVKNICKERGIAISKLEKDCGFCNGYISGLKKGVFPSDRLLTVAKYLGVSLNELSETAAAMNIDYIVQMNSENNNEIKILTETLNGPYRSNLLAYAKKLNDLMKMDEDMDAKTNK